MDFTPGTLVSLNVKFSFGTPDYKAPSTNKTPKLTKVLSESDVYFFCSTLPLSESVRRRRPGVRATGHDSESLKLRLNDSEPRLHVGSRRFAAAAASVMSGICSLVISESACSYAPPHAGGRIVGGFVC